MKTFEVVTQNGKVFNISAKSKSDLKRSIIFEVTQRKNGTVKLITKREDIEPKSCIYSTL